MISFIGGLNEAVIAEQKEWGVYDLLKQSLDLSKKRFAGA